MPTNKKRNSPTEVIDAVTTYLTDAPDLIRLLESRRKAISEYNGDYRPVADTGLLDPQSWYPFVAAYNKAVAAESVNNKTFPRRMAGSLAAFIANPHKMLLEDLVSGKTTTSALFQEAGNPDPEFDDLAQTAAKVALQSVIASEKALVSDLISSDMEAAFTTASELETAASLETESALQGLIPYEESLEHFQEKEIAEILERYENALVAYATKHANIFIDQCVKRGIEPLKEMRENPDAPIADEMLAYKDRHRITDTAEDIFMAIIARKLAADPDSEPEIADIIEQADSQAAMKQEKTLLTAIGNVAPEPGSYFESIDQESTAASYATADEIMAEYRTGRAAVAGKQAADGLTAAVNAIMDPKIATLLRELAYIRQGKIQVVPSLDTVPPARILRKYHKQMRKRASEHKSNIEDIIMDQARYLASGDLAGYVSERQALAKELRMLEIEPSIILLDLIDNHAGTKARPAFWK